MLRASLNTQDVDKVIFTATMTVPGALPPERIVANRRADGFLDPGFHYFIDSAARVTFGVPMNECGSWFPRYARDSVVVLLDGGIHPRRGAATDTFTEEQMAAARRLLREIKREFPGARSVLHRELFKGTNPNFDKERLYEPSCFPA